MKTATQLNFPLVSVIITTYNHGHFLPEALDSIFKQAYPAIEVVVVDDGSTDNTREIIKKYEEVHYIYQENQGLSAARNTGVRHSKGELLLFLDADDWLLPAAIGTNVRYIQQNEQYAFVSGGHYKIFVEAGMVEEDNSTISDAHYSQLLKGNYIGMHAAVMYRRWVFDEFLYDVSLKACEDYDLYLKIARKYPVFHHSELIAAYRQHSANMSANVSFMLSAALQVLDRQQSQLLSPAEKKAYAMGQAAWKEYYREQFAERQRAGSITGIEDVILRSWLYKKKMRKVVKSHAAKLKRLVKNHTPSFGLRILSKTGLYKNFLPAPGKVNSGDFNRQSPFSKDFGYDRGGPVDRYYIENFLAAEAAVIRGRVLEIGDNDYTIRFGGERILRSDILHINEHNPMATIIGDISNAPHIPDNCFDCIVLTQTLHLIYDFKEALHTCHRILKPGGTLLLTVPGITPIDHGQWKESWYWSFTDKAIGKLLAESFPHGKIGIKAFGNVFTAAAFLYGMGLQEVASARLKYHDPHFQVIVAGKATKAGVL